MQSEEQEKLLVQESENMMQEMEFQGARYKGGTLNSLPHGWGRLQGDDGSYYEGYWKRGVKTGRGRFVDENKNVQEGVWRGNKVNGFLKMRLMSGRTF